MISILSFFTKLFRRRPATEYLFGFMPYVVPKKSNYVHFLKYKDSTPFSVLRWTDKEGDRLSITRNFRFIGEQTKIIYQLSTVKYPDVVFKDGKFKFVETCAEKMLN